MAIFRRVRFLTCILPPVQDDCSTFQSRFGFINDSLTQEELQFPLAFSVIVHTHAEMLLKLLAAIYRPHNYYCVHLDTKAPEVRTDRVSDKDV